MNLLPCICRGGGPPKAVEGPSSYVRRPAPALLDNEHDDAFQIVPHIGGGNSDRADSLLRHPFVAALVTLGIVAKLMREPVNLDRQARFMTEEVEDIRLKGVLSAKLESLGPNLERVP